LASVCRDFRLLVKKPGRIIQWLLLVTALIGCLEKLPIPNVLYKKVRKATFVQGLDVRTVIVEQHN